MPRQKFSFDSGTLPLLGPLHSPIRSLNCLPRLSFYTLTMVNVKRFAIAATVLFSTVLAVPMVAAEGQSVATSHQSPPIEGKYIIALKPGLKPRDLDTHLDWVDGVHKRGLSPEQFRGVEKTYSGSYNFHGYAGHFDEATIAAIRRNPDVSGLNLACLVLPDCRIHRRLTNRRG